MSERVTNGSNVGGRGNKKKTEFKARNNNAKRPKRNEAKLIERNFDSAGPQDIPVSSAEVIYYFLVLCSTVTAVYAGNLPK